VNRAAGLVASLAALALALPAAAGAGAKDRTERAVRSHAPDARVVRESFVRLRDPLPAGSAAHPARCDWITYLRFRHRRGPRKATRADAVVVLIPGFLGGAKSFDQLARNSVREAAASGRRIEVWVLDRRANCLEDRHGIRAAARAGGIEPAFDYYYGGREVDGRRFPGFATPEEARFLEDFGLERTVRDWHTVLRRDYPGRRRRAKRVICGGHSLGGPLTAAFASWDFDGDPETAGDAGYNQCAGFVGLDTTVELGGDDGTPAGTGVISGTAQTGAAPFINVPPLTPGTMQLTSIAGVGAWFTPAEESPFNQLVPRTPEYETTLRLLYSRDAVNFATGRPSIRDFRVTHAAVLGAIFDDNSAGLGFIRASLGFVTGGPLTDKNFPAPNPTLALPEQPNGPLYGWQGYRQVGAGGAPVELNDSGQPYTSRESEISSIRQLARTKFEAPSNFIEQYFPTRIVTDVAAAGAGDRSGDFEDIRYDGPSMRPILLIQARDSDENTPDDGGPPIEGEAPNDRPGSREVILPGYNHLDVLTAARRQNDGLPEPASAELAAFAAKVVPPRRRRR
jgi:hypothetical protein